MNLFILILHIILYTVWIFLLLNVLYLIFFALAGFRKVKHSITEVINYRKICVLLPAYKEDAVIIDSGLDAIAHKYIGEFDVCVIADKLQPETVKTLQDHHVNVVEVKFEKSTKGKALWTALAALPKNDYDIAVVLDADNLMGKGFLDKINLAFEEGFRVVQGHRTAKNIDTPFAMLDACNEEINNHIFRKGHVNAGLSSALIGSGMAFDYNYFIELLDGIGETVGEDKEIDFRILKDGVKIAYLNDALVYDEKIANANVFQNQRTRWIATQIEFLKKYFGEGFRLLFKEGNIEFFDKVIQTVLLPRILLMGILTLLTLISFLLPFGPPALFWVIIWLIGVVSLLISVPKRLYNRDLLQAVLRLPLAFVAMAMALLRIKRAGKSFMHTPHTARSHKPQEKE
ncbi:MAG TPA: glycosyltransferase family 2 protein [Anditalea sp.]|nr:glycosyltransferase family 2 protein [Anditalea sp.]